MLAMALIVLLAFIDVIGRYMLSKSLPGGFDIALRLQAFVILWGIALASRERAHICVDLLAPAMTARLGSFVQTFANACTMLFFAACGFAAVLQIPKLYGNGERLAGVDIPAWPFQVLAYAGLVLAAVAAIRPKPSKDA